MLIYITCGSKLRVLVKIGSNFFALLLQFCKSWLSQLLYKPKQVRWSLHCDFNYLFTYKNKRGAVVGCGFWSARQRLHDEFHYHSASQNALMLVAGHKYRYELGYWSRPCFCRAGCIVLVAELAKTSKIDTSLWSPWLISIGNCIPCQHRSRVFVRIWQ